MKQIFMLGAVLLVSMVVAAQTTNYTVSNLVTSSQAPHLLNPWGLARPSSASLSENEWWAADQASGLSTLYDANGSRVALYVTVPPASGTGVGSPTGITYNPLTLQFAFATLDGTISAWSANTKPTTVGTSCLSCHVTTANIMVNNSGFGASYQGLTIGTNATTAKLAYYAANANGGVEAYDAASFSPLTLASGAFTDPAIPSSYTPAGIKAFGEVLVVTYNAAAGGGTGYVDAFNSQGKLLLRLEDGNFNQPWGIAISPANFGTFSNMILIGNTGSGLIGAYKLSNGSFQGFLQNNGENVVIPGLWGIAFGDGNTESGPTNVLYFNSGGESQTTGAFGSITAN
jgi:uncharacterized protein (TIGR03118 family)